MEEQELWFLLAGSTAYGTGVLWDLKPARATSSALPMCESPKRCWLPGTSTEGSLQMRTAEVLCPRAEGGDCSRLSTKEIRGAKILRRGWLGLGPDSLEWVW